MHINTFIHIHINTSTYKNYAHCKQQTHQLMNVHKCIPAYTHAHLHMYFTHVTTVVYTVEVDLTFGQNT